tara:strand:+ start:267 stop:440 length:174 start_codon:yes stop_codon:yes gene_type:complete
MDLHNNEVGRSLFQQEITSEEIIEKLQEMMKEAQFVDQATEIPNYPERLVYLESLKN